MTAPRKTTSVLVIDDSALIRKLLTEIIDSQPDMRVVGTAANPVVAREKIKALNPDVLTLDIEMPVMNGLDFLEKLMLLRPMPVVMISTMTERGGELTLRALELGAVDYVPKPKLGIAGGMQAYAQEICAKLRVAAAARVFPRRASAAAPPAQACALRTGCCDSTEKLIVVGASTGGTEALRSFLMQMPPDCPGILIAQHMPENFTRSFAQRLDRLCAISVCEAAEGQRILPGHAFIAPGHSHLLLRRNGANYVTGLSQSDPVNRHRPSVDVLFHSAAMHAGVNAIGVILTGMGKDGATGMLAMHKAGARTYAQDEASCVVFGMPREAIALDAVDEVLPLCQIAPRVVRSLEASHSLRI